YKCYEYQRVTLLLPAQYSSRQILLYMPQPLQLFLHPLLLEQVVPNIMRILKPRAMHLAVSASVSTLSEIDVHELSHDTSSVLQFLSQVQYLYQFPLKLDPVQYVTQEMLSIHLRFVQPLKYIPAKSPSVQLPLYKYGHFYRVTSSDRKSTPLNSSHVSISYAVFCLKQNI